MSFINYVLLLALLAFNNPVMSSIPSQREVDYTKAINACNKLCRAKNSDIIQTTEVILKHSNRVNINPNLIFAIAMSESNLNPKAVGPGKYSKGIMQVNTRYHLSKFKKSALDLDDNIRVGVDILKTCSIKSQGNFSKMVFCYRGKKDKQYLSKIQKYMSFNIFPMV